MRLKGCISALGAFFVVALLAACGSGVPGNSVANVAGNPISRQALQSPGAPIIVPTDPPQFTQCIAQIRAQAKTSQVLASLAKQSDAKLRTDCKSLFSSLSSQVMDFLIKAYWYQADAAKQNVKVTDAEVQKVYTSAKKQQFPSQSQFQAFLTQTGQTVQDILFRFRVNQIFTKLMAKHNGKVTPAQIQAYYQSHLSQFGTPETRNMRIVLTKTQAQALQAKSALAHGQSWNAVAKKFSTDTTTKNQGGQLVGVTKGQQDSALDAAAFSAPLNKVLGPVKGQFGYYIFEVTKITKGTQQSLTQATPQIKQTLTSQQQQNAQKAVDNQAKKDWLSKTTCRSLYAMADCKGFKAPKTSTTSGTTSTP
jgi:foldase protein PrsA